MRAIFKPYKKENKFGSCRTVLILSLVTNSLPLRLHKEGALVRDGKLMTYPS